MTRNLQSVGKEKFVEFFDLFQSYAKGKINREDCIERLVTEGASNEAGAAIRCSNAKAIFKKEMEEEALKIITVSERISPEIRARAQELLVVLRLSC